ncbi:MAG: M48 family metalloprotease [Oligoflexus sp.]
MNEFFRRYTGSLLGASMCLATFMISCTMSHKSKIVDQENENLSVEERKRMEELKAEMEVGRNMAGRLLEFYGVYENEDVVRYLNEIGSLVASHSPFPDRRFMFDILNYDQPNAFACPGGYILISLGAIKNAKNEAELAAILGHEIAHVGRQHMYKQLQSMNEDELDEMAEQSRKSNLPNDIAIRKRPEPEDSEAISFLARYMAGSVAGLNVLKAARAGMSLILEKGLGADLEFEADTDGVRYAINAGYHPAALIEYLCRIETSRTGKKQSCYQEPEKDRKKTILDRTHPPVSQRIDKIKSVLKEVDASRIVGAHGEKRFLHYKKRIAEHN